MSLPALQRIVLEQGADDWMSLESLDSWARLLQPDAEPAERARQLADAIAELVARGLVMLGSVDNEVGFTRSCDAEADPHAPVSVLQVHKEYPHRVFW